MAVGVLIAGLGYYYGGLYLVRAYVHKAGLYVEVAYGQQALALAACELDYGLPRVEGGGGVCGGNAVAGVAAYGAYVAYLRAAYHVHRLTQHVYVFLDNGIPGYVGEAGKGAYADAVVFVNGYAPQFVKAVYGDELLAGTFALAHLHENVAAAGYYLCLGVFEAKLHGVLNGGSLIQRFKIVHVIFPPLSIRPL